MEEATLVLALLSMEKAEGGHSVKAHLHREAWNPSSRQKYSSDFSVGKTGDC